MTDRQVLCIVLAAGKGTRMCSEQPKVLHRIAGRSMLAHVIATGLSAGTTRTAVVVGPGMAAVASEALKLAPVASIHVQERQQGTADAVLAAREALAGWQGDIVVLYGDTPLIEPATLGRLAAALDRGAAVAVLGFEARDPTGYGRLITDAAGRLVAIREHREANDVERAVRLCNSGVMAFRCPNLLSILDRITNTNAKGEYYLTDAVEIALADGLGAAVVACPEDEVLGVNDRTQLATAEAIWQARARTRAMLAGATLIAPDTVWFAYDTTIGRDVVIEPNVFFGPGVTIEADVEIKANCHIEGALVGRGARVGPFARLRPGADLGPDVHIGNFVEVKNVALAKGAKANHLAYLGDGAVGAGANIGAGTIFCNYDGFTKSRTEVGAGAFVGSNSSLVAPVTVGAGAFIGSGSVVTSDVAADSLVLERAPTTVKEGWAARFRAKMQALKAAKSAQKG